MTLAPVPNFPEKARTQSYEREYGDNRGGNEGPRRFEEGIVSDTDVPRDFGRGAYSDTDSLATRAKYNNPDAQYKHADETMRERAHVGSSSWIEADSMLGDFAKGAFAGHGLPQYEQVNNPGTRVTRRNPVVVED